MRWHARAAVGAVGAISLLELRAGAAVFAIGVGGVRGYSDAVLALGGGGHGTLGPQSAQSEPLVSTVGAVCVLGAWPPSSQMASEV
jgi:hypothetical protein